MRKILIWLFPLALAAGAPPARASADDLKGAQSLLCTADEATLCTEDGNCLIESPSELNIPEFLEVNLTAKKLSTTKASGENRSTPIRTLERADGVLFIQGIEEGRAFSFVISESTGLLSAAIARDGETISILGRCTPTSAAK